MLPEQPERVLVIGCGALARELLEVVRRNGLGHVTVECLPAWYHNRPENIPDAVAERIERGRDSYDRIYVGYGDCGTGGRLDALLEEEAVERLPGAHCYEFLAGGDTFSELHEEDPATFYVTDYLVRHFERLVVSGLGLDDHPELLDVYFGNYRRLVYLSQTQDPELVDRAAQAARRLGLRFEHRHCGYGDLEPALVGAARR